VSFCDKRQRCIFVEAGSFLSIHKILILNIADFQNKIIHRLQTLVCCLLWSKARLLAAAAAATFTMACQGTGLDKKVQTPLFFPQPAELCAIAGFTPCHYIKGRRFLDTGLQIIKASDPGVKQLRLPAGSSSKCSSCDHVVTVQGHGSTSQSQS
jgi:hypothetical protein